MTERQRNYLEVIEVKVKSVFAYEFTRVYGATGYLDSTNFTNVIRHTEILQKAEVQKNPAFSMKHI